MGQGSVRGDKSGYLISWLSIIRLPQTLGALMGTDRYRQTRRSGILGARPTLIPAGTRPRDRSSAMTTNDVPSASTGFPGDWTEGLGRLFGEEGFGPISQIVTGGIEGLLFVTCVVGAMMIARRRFE